VHRQRKIGSALWLMRRVTRAPSRHEVPDPPSHRSVEGPPVGLGWGT
jgi:hypothetical protein